jgi:hypothetical protein
VTDEEQQEVNSLEEAIDLASSSVTTIPEKIWEQWPSEPDEWYAAFLIYLSLGRGRSVGRAYQLDSVSAQEADIKISGEERTIIIPAKASASWHRAASRWHWQERAMRHDVYALAELVPQTVTIIFQTIGEFARVTMEQLQNNSVTPENWRDVREAVETLASYISPEIIQATVAHAGSSGDRILEESDSSNE